MAHEILDDKRRLRVAKVLLGYGERVQYSLFECQISKVEYLRMREKLDEVLDPSQDAVSFYFLCESCRRKIARIGPKRPLLDDAVFIGWEDADL